MLLDKPVRIKVPKGVDIIVSTEQAGRRLLDWPKKRDTAKQKAARAAVLKSLESAHNHRLKVQAREALEDAAKEAGILIPSSSEHEPR